MKVLFADNDEEMRDYVSMLLEAGLDCEILEASSGNEALSVLEFDNEIDFVISEVSMPNGSGNLIVDYLDQNRICVPFIWLSNPKNRDVLLVQEVLSRSPKNAFIPKPFKDTDFFPIIDKILNSSSIQSVSSNNTSSKTSINDEWENLNEESDENEEIADWSLKKKNQGKETDADWSLKKNENEEGVEADWSLKKEWNGDDQEADWSLEKKDQGEQTLSYDKMAKDSWEKIRKENHDKEKKAKADDNSKSGDNSDYDQDRFRRVKIKRFYNFNEVCCDVFIQLNPKKYVKLLNGRDNYEIPFIEKFENRGKKYLFIEKEYFQRFQEQFGHLVLAKLEKAQNLPAEVKVLAELSAYEHTLGFAKEFGITENTAHKVKKSIESNLKTLKKLPKLEELLKRIMRGSDYISEHSLLVSYFSCQICSATAWGNAQVMEKLSMAALLHDVSLEDERLARVHRLSDAKEMDLAPSEIEAIKNHPGMSAKLISEGESIFSDVDIIVLQHHELPDQSGFPRGLGALSISPLSCIFILASELVERIYGKKANEVDMEQIKSEMKESFNKGNFKKPLEALLKVF